MPGKTLARLHVVSTVDGWRRREPITVGLPLHKGALGLSQPVALVDERDHDVCLQTTSLDSWSDGSVRWLLVDFQADLDPSAAGSRVYSLTTRDIEIAPEGPGVAVSDSRSDIAVDTGPVRFRITRAGHLQLEVFRADQPPVGPERGELVIEDESGNSHRVTVRQVNVEMRGPVRAVVRVEGTLQLMNRTALTTVVRLHFYAGQPTVRVELTVRNPRAATHPGGFWELGDPGSCSFRDVSFIITLPTMSVARTVDCSPEPGMPVARSDDGTLELYQDSSGGANWQSRNHVDRSGAVAVEFPGYHLRAGTERKGARATPLVTLTDGRRRLVVSMPRFWQNFPKAIAVDGDSLRVGLFPREHGGQYELQGGEQKTHTFFVSFGDDHVSESPLEWTRSPLFAHTTPELYASSGAVPYLLPAHEDPDGRYAQLVREAIDGDHSFWRKREAIDEYGWRHFGDVYADHEAVLATAPSALVSHYNNQYDVIAGLATQFMRGVAIDWWTLLLDLASHVVDIDVYHTSEDRPLYNNGLFWHTAHYTDAGRSTHRGYPRAPGVPGGGPSPEHNYTKGLLLHHFLTGAPASRETAIGLAQWVIDMDDGLQTPARWLTRSPTGWASATGAGHGPGRGAGNSINALLDGFRLTHDRRFLGMADVLIRRCIHPADDIEGRGLLDAERRWSYTVFLHALGRYLDDKTEAGNADAMYDYTRATLLAYADWMSEHEEPYLDHPEKLEYPTETWAAQELWKSEVFLFAAKYAASAGQRRRFQERADFFVDYALTTLLGMDTRTLARPMALVLSHGFMHGCLARYPALLPEPAPQTPRAFGRPARFVPQKTQFKRRVLIGGIALSALTLAAILYVLL